MKVHIPKGESTGLYSTTVQQVRVCRFIPDGESTGLYSATVQQVRVCRFIYMYLKERVQDYTVLQYSRYEYEGSHT